VSYFATERLGLEEGEELLPGIVLEEGEEQRDALGAARPLAFAPPAAARREGVNVNRIRSRRLEGSTGRLSRPSVPW
jgi:hypothetical protein